MWIKRFSARLYASKLPVIVENNHYGVSQLADTALNTCGSALWIELQSSDITELANASWGLPSDRPIRTLSQALKIHGELLGSEAVPILILSNAEFAPSLVDEILLISQDVPHKILISCRSVQELNLRSAERLKILTPRELLPSRTEILVHFSSISSLHSWLEPDHKQGVMNYEAFLKATYRKIGRPLPKAPTPLNYGPIACCITRTRTSLFEILISNRHWFRAFELVMSRNPREALSLLDFAAEDAIARNELARLYQYIKQLRNEFPRVESVIYWKIVIERHLGLPMEGSLRQSLDIDMSDYPRLQLLSALLGHRDERPFFVPDAVPSDDVSQMLAAHVRAFTNDQGALNEIFSSLRTFEREGRSYRYVQTLGVVANTLLLQGQYRESGYWAAKAIRFLDEFEIGGFQKALASSLLSYAYLLSGDPVKAGETLAPLSLTEDLLDHPSADGILSTLGDQFACAGHFRTALNWYREVSRKFDGPASDLVLPDLALSLVRLEQSHEALAVTRRRLHELHVSEISYPWVFLAWAIGHLTHKPAKAEELLRVTFIEHRKRLIAPMLGRAAILLAVLLLRRREQEEALEVLLSVSETLDGLGLSGWLLLSGRDPDIEELHKLWHLNVNPLQASFMGQDTWSYKNVGSEDIDSLRIKEMLYILSKFPDGLTGDQLSEHMGLNIGAEMTIRSHVRRLRQYVPLDARPYRLPVKVQADFLDLELNLELGNVEGILDCYKGPLLPESDAPFIREARRYLEARTRKIILAKGGPTEIAEFALVVRDDMELLETALTLNQGNKDWKLVARLEAAISRLRAEWDEEVYSFQGPGINEKTT